MDAAGLGDESQAVSSYAAGVAELASVFAESFRNDTINILMAHTHVEGAKLAKESRKILRAIFSPIIFLPSASPVSAEDLTVVRF